MKQALLALLISVSALLGDTYVTPSIKDIEQSSNLVIIGSIECIEMTHKSEFGLEVGLHSARLVKEKITILVGSILRGKTNDQRIILEHTYYETEPLERVEERAKEVHSILNQIKTLLNIYSEKHEASEQFEGSKEATEILNKIDTLQRKADTLLDPSRESASTEITELWRPPETDEYLIFLKKEGNEYNIPFAGSFRKLSQLKRPPENATEIK